MWSRSTVENNENKKIIKTIENRIITLYLDETIESVFKIDNVEFIPSEMILKSILFRDLSGDIKSNFTILSDIVNWNQLAFFNNLMTNIAYLNIKFQFNKQANGTYKIKFVDYLSNPIKVSGYLSFHLEFSKLN